MLDKLSNVYVDNDEIIGKIDLSSLSNQEKIDLLSRQPVLLKVCSQILKNLSGVVKDRIALARQAFNIDSTGNDGGSIEECLKEVS